MLVAQFQADKSSDLHVPKEILKPQEDGTRKVRTRLRLDMNWNTGTKIVQWTFVPIEQQVEKLTKRELCIKALKNNKRSKKTHRLYRTARDKRTYIRYYKKTMGLQSH
jgi:hypothetical protein